MKQLVLTFALTLLCCATFAQRRTTTVRSYTRKDGTHVSSHTRHYNAGSGSYSGGTFTGSTGYTPGIYAESPDIIHSNMSVSNVGKTGGYKKAGGVPVIPTSLQADSNGVTVLVAVLRYNDTTVLDISPIQKTIVNYDYETNSTSLVFRIPKDRLKQGEVLQLLSNWDFYDKDDYIVKSIYLGIGKVSLPPYLSLKVEAITLR